jgi:hypothetical protein
MRTALIAVLAGGCAASAQVNPGLESGDLSGYAAFVPSTQFTQVLGGTAGGLNAFEGSYCAQLWAGNLSQDAAEQAMDIASGRLAKLYTDLGGTGDETAGTYNVLRADLAPGKYYFYWVYEGGDIDNPNYVDHAFVVDGTGAFTVLADGLSGGFPAWQQASFVHPGGPAYFVSANGGDGAFPPALYVDDIQSLPAGNPSFEFGTTDWNVEDAGAGHALVTSQTDAGKQATDGNLMVRLVAGEMTPAQATQLMKLDSGELADLYQSIGGNGDAGANDYLALWQEMPAGDVTFDWTVEDGDVFYSEFADHAFAVNGAGEISLLYNSVQGPVAGWQTATVPHPGGKFFIVIANGGDDGNDPLLFVDNVRRGMPAVDAAHAWDAVTPTANEWGDGDVETFGQTFVAAGTALDQMTFYVDDHGETIEYQAYVYAWNGQHATGEAIFASGVRATDGADVGFEPVVIETPGARLVEGEPYVAFLTVSNTMPTGANARFGLTGANPIAGHFVHSNNGANFGVLLSQGWGVTFQDLACRFEFGEAGVSVAPEVFANVEGQISNNWPWNVGTSFRYQQVYRADQLEGAGVVDRFFYRPDSELGKKVTEKVVNCKIWLGHTDRDPGELSETFDDNFSADKTLVHDGPMVISSSGLGGFDIEIDVLDAFEYNGQDNLLMEIVIPDTSNSGVGSFDTVTAQSEGPGAGPTPWTNRVAAYGANAQTGAIDQLDGLATRFEMLEPAAPCIADCDENGQLNILDFVCYQFLFEQGDASADCNADGVLNILDFVCFQGEFQGGCP